MTQVKTIVRKVTKQGLVVTLIQNEVQVHYMRTLISVTSFPNRMDAKREFGKYRQSHKDLAI